MLYDSISMRFPTGVTVTETGSRRRAPGAGGGGGESVFGGDTVYLQDVMSSGDAWWGRLQNNENALNATELDP